MKILAISGSLRKQSSNKSLLLATRAVSPQNIQIEIFEDISVLPHFNPDLDTEHPPEAVVRFRQAVSQAQALIISTPEYAHGIPGSLKNALDWLVRDPDFGGKRVGLIYGSATDASHAHLSLLEVLKTMSAEIPSDAIVSIASVRTKIDDNGNLLDPSVRHELVRVVSALASQS